MDPIIKDELLRGIGLLWLYLALSVSILTPESFGHISLFIRLMIPVVLTGVTVLLLIFIRKQFKNGKKIIHLLVDLALINVGILLTWVYHHPSIGIITLIFGIGGFVYWFIVLIKSS